MSRTYKQQNAELRAEVKLLEEALHQIMGDMLGGMHVAQNALERLEEMRSVRLAELQHYSLFGTKMAVDRAVGKNPLLAAPYGKSRYNKEARHDIYKATAEAILRQSSTPPERATSKYLEQLAQFRPRASEGFKLPDPAMYMSADPSTQCVWSNYYAGEYFDKLRKYSLKEWREQYECTPKLKPYHHCPFCNELTIYNHRDGVPVCKCPDKACKGHERWLEYSDFAELGPTAREWREQYECKPEQSLYPVCPARTKEALQHNWQWSSVRNAYYCMYCNERKD